MAEKKYVAYATGNDDSDTFFTSVEDAVGDSAEAKQWWAMAQPGDALILKKGAFYGQLTLIKLSGELTVK